MINDEAKRLRLFLERENMDQKDLATLLKTQESSISRYCSGDRKFPLRHIKTMHIKLGLNYSWFFHGIGTLKYKAVDKRNIVSDLTDIQAGLGVIMSSQDEMRDVLNKLVRDFYADKHKV